MLCVVLVLVGCKAVIRDLPCHSHQCHVLALLAHLIILLSVVIQVLLTERIITEWTVQLLVEPVILHIVCNVI